MKAKLSIGAFAVFSALAATPAFAADWSDTSASWRYGTHFAEPAIEGAIKKNIFALTHVSGYKYGTNFFNVDFLLSDENDPAAGGKGGAQEVYAVYANQLHLGKLTGSDLSFGPVRDIALTTGFDASAKNTDFAARVRKFTFGPTLKFGVLDGWFDLSLLYYKETNHNGIVGTDVNFDSTYRVAGAWDIPFSAGPVPLSFNGFFTYTGEKGKDGFGADTKPETLADLFLMADVGALAGKKGTFKAGIGYEYWTNKFGNDHTQVIGSNAYTPMIKAEVHF
ncbi:hypothetical protein GCM10025771_32350 [Niveibacterium umoris]|uniref:Nucleoside-specific outer membrane channel protein Tsx n=1 Tax=Niveibacterium umoris TaxID=1193620 RepID=A0A840BEW4_9RHOO|nr:hypothetical protein [Niveibacterium umoris]MBB4011570.1 nucleoside-specific outer membrane channel protein Tsx [Niveibacterium umoris]